MVIRREDAISPQDIEHLHRGLVDVHPPEVGVRDIVKVAFTARDDEGMVLGGVLAVIAWHWLHVHTLSVDPVARGAGIGHRLLADLEVFAIAEGCTHARVDTFDFGARTFYERVGYSVYGELKGFPAGHTQFHLSKVLDAPAAG
jgi:GNAT superfamily N-acetyltransferase